MKLEANQAVRFSYDIIKGSIEKRNNSVRKINDRIYNEILENAENNVIHVDDIIDIVQYVLPERKKIKICNIGKKEKKRAYADVINDYKDDYSGHEIGLPLKKLKMKIENLPIFMHEITHVLDDLYNPKFTKRQHDIESAAKKMGDVEVKTVYEKGLTLYENDIYKREKFKNDNDKKKIIEELSQKVKKYLSGKTVDEKIDYIQNTRYFLQSELNAYTTDHIYAKRMKDAGYKIDMSDYEGNVENFMLREKLVMLKEIGGDIINKARRKSKVNSYSNPN